MYNIKSHMELFHGDEHLLDVRCEGECEYRCSCNDRREMLEEDDMEEIF